METDQTRQRRLVEGIVGRLRPKASEAGGFDLAVGGESRAITLKRSRRARRFTLRVKPGSGEIVLTVPAWARVADARAFAERHAAWLSQRLATASRRTPFEHGAIIPVRGVPHRVVATGRLRGEVERVEREDGVIELRVGGDEPHIERRVVDYLKREARHDLLHAVAIHSARIGKKASRVTVRDQTTRWGSCSSSGAISFSWRLIMAPPFVLDYLAAHEVAHLKEMNHGPRFWRLCRELCPEMDRAKVWMRTEGSTLHAHGPVAGHHPDPDAI